MHLLPVVPVGLLAVVTVWLVWPLLADPVARHLGYLDDDAASDDPIDAWAELARPEGGFARTERG